MKLSSKTIEVLKNFAQINQSIYINKGSVLRTISESADILGRANVDEDFPNDFAIYDLNRFLGVLSLFEDPEIDLESNDKYMVISDARTTVRYVFTNPSLITRAPDKDLSDQIKKKATSTKTVAVAYDDMKRVLRGANVMGNEDISFLFEGDKCHIVADDSEDVTSSNFTLSMEVEDATDDKEGKVAFKTSNFKFLPRDYKALLTDCGIAEFSSDDVTYWVAPNRNNTTFK